MVRLKAYAKINWLLDIVGVKDGFHMLDGIMETISLYDEITVDIRADSKIHTLYKDMEEMPGDLCSKAAKAFFAETGLNNGADIYVEKHIPMGAGLGGGSSDCACVLCYLNNYFGKPISRERLFKIASDLGADVPFFIDGGAQRARGKGEILEPIAKDTVQDLIIARPMGKGVSTPEAFKLYDAISAKNRGDVEGMIAALKNGDVRKIADKLYNALEIPSMELLEDIKRVKELLCDAGAEAAVMTGSGSSVIGLMRDESKAMKFPDDVWYVCCTTIKKPWEEVN